MNKLLIIGLVFFVGLQSYAQDETQQIGRPNIPGTLQVEYGHSFSPLDSVPFKVLGNRTANFYYMLDKPLGASKFSFHIGAGVGLDRVKFTTDSQKRHLTLISKVDSSIYYAIRDKDKVVSKSMFITNYVDVPLEFRFNTAPNDRAKNFFVAIGGRVGYMMRAQTKVKYTVNNETNRTKEQKSFNLTPVRYSTYLRVGVGAFNLYANYALSPLFKDGEGPRAKPIQMMTVGMSFELF